MFETDLPGTDESPTVMYIERSDAVFAEPPQCCLESRLRGVRSETLITTKPLLV